MENKKKLFEVGGVIIIKKKWSWKKEDDEIHEESWVRCNKCERCIHQICALCNTCQNKDQRSKYVCPSYTIETRWKWEVTEGIWMTAEDPSRPELSRTDKRMAWESY